MPTSNVFAGLEQQADTGMLWPRLVAEILQAAEHFKGKAERRPHGHGGTSRGKRQNSVAPFSTQRQRCTGAGATTTERG